MGHKNSLNTQIMTFADIHTYTQLLLYINHETWDLLTWDLLTKQPLIPRQVSRVCPRLNWRITMSWMVLYCSETMRSIIETKTHYIYLRNAVRSRECNWVKRGCSVDESLSETTLRPPQAFTKVTSRTIRLLNFYSNFPQRITCEISHLRQSCQSRHVLLVD